MDEVIRQTDEDYKLFLYHMRIGTIPTERCDWLMAMCLTRISHDKAQEFKDALHICPTWKVANIIYYEYLDYNLNKPIVILQGKMGGSKSRSQNCCADDSCLPVVTPICKGAMVMLLMNKLWKKTCTTNQWD